MEINDKNIVENQNNFTERTDTTAETLLEQLESIKAQIQNVSSTWQNKTTHAIDNVKHQITDFFKKIESDIYNIKVNVINIENELIELQEKESDKNITFFQEILRKSIHFTSLSIPICYYFFTKETMMMLLVPLMIGMVVFDLATKINPFLRTHYLKVFGFMLRKHEIKRNELFLNGASWVMIAAVVTIFFFPETIAIISLSVLFISDVIAAIIGRKFGKKRFLHLKRKSVVGTTSFAITAMIISII